MRGVSITLSAAADRRQTPEGPAIFDVGTPPLTSPAGETLLHTAVVAKGSGELIDAALAALRRGSGENDATYAVVTAERSEALRRRLGDDLVTFTDAERWNPHPARRLRALHALVDEQRLHGGGRVHFINECSWHVGPAEMADEWARFEAALNFLFADAPLDLVCVYDASTLSPAVVGHAAETHPRLGAAGERPSPAYLTPETFAARNAAKLVPPLNAARLDDNVSPARARKFLEEAAAEGELTREQLDALTVVLTEIVTNSWKAGARAVSIAAWRSPAGVAVQVDDDGPGLTDLFAGYRRPALDAATGRGLWIARQLADLVQTAPRERGTSVRVELFDRHDPAESGTIRRIG